MVGQPRAAGPQRPSQTMISLIVLEHTVPKHCAGRSPPPFPTGFAVGGDRFDPKDRRLSGRRLYCVTEGRVFETAPDVWMAFGIDMYVGPQTIVSNQRLQRDVMVCRPQTHGGDQDVHHTSGMYISTPNYVGGVFRPIVGTAWCIIFASPREERFIYRAVPMIGGKTPLT